MCAVPRRLILRAWLRGQDVCSSTWTKQGGRCMRQRQRQAGKDWLEERQPKRRATLVHSSDQHCSNNGIRWSTLSNRDRCLWSLSSRGFFNFSSCPFFSPFSLFPLLITCVTLPWSLMWVMWDACVFAECLSRILLCLYVVLMLYSGLGYCTVHT